MVRENRAFWRWILKIGGDGGGSGGDGDHACGGDDAGVGEW